ncbi:MAG: AsmA family protein, partial [Bosea sp. (in: a-proteobacteria)]
MAGLVLLALLGALVGPVFVDWNQHRSAIEDQLKRATGIEMVTTGPIHVRFLPSPRLKISGLRVGDADPQATRATIAVLRAEIELGPLLRGALQLTSLELDGVDLRLAVRDGALALPEVIGDSFVVPGIARLAVTRGQVTVLDADGQARAALPFSIEASLPQALGPARVDGEIAGRSLRLTTGDRDAAGRLRIKVASSDARSRGEFDGWLGAETTEGGRIAFRPDGQLQIALLKPGEAQAAGTVTGKLLATGSGFVLSALVVDAGAVGRMDGEAAWNGDWNAPAKISLQSRRADLETWLGGDGGLMLAANGLGWLADQLPDIDLKLSADQLSFRGEEATEGQLLLQRRGAVWRPAAGQLRFAGASAGFVPLPGDVMRASIDVPDLRRIALAMQRLDMPQGLAEDIAALGQLSGSAELAEVGGGWQIKRFQADGRFGQAIGEGRIAANRIGLSASFTGADVLFLVRPLMAMAELAATDLDVSLSGQAMRIGASPPGSGQVRAMRLGGHWRVDAVSARGFDGVDLDLKRNDPAAPLQISLSAARADAISAVAERFTASQHLSQVLRSLRGLSPVRLAGVLGERGDGWSVSTTGQAGVLALEGRAQFDKAGRWQSGDVVLSSGQRGVLFRALGLPEPAASAVATRFGARLGANGPVIVITGTDGLAIEARGAWAPEGAGVLGNALNVTLQAPSLSAVLPGFGGIGDGGEVLSGKFRLVFGEGSIGFDGIEA